MSRNAGVSHYNALQVQFQRRMSHGLQALVSYNLAESNDMGSTDADGVRAASMSDVVLPPLTPSDFDTRHAFTGAVSYEIPYPSLGRCWSGDPERLGGGRDWCASRARRPSM